MIRVKEKYYSLAKGDGCIYVHHIILIMLIYT